LIGGDLLGRDRRRAAKKRARTIKFTRGRPNRVEHYRDARANPHRAVAAGENFVSRFEDTAGSQVSWLRKLDAGNLKIRLATAIVAISSIHLLQVFLNVEK
jgi:hypothetical protein